MAIEDIDGGGHGKLPIYSIYVLSGRKAEVERRMRFALLLDGNLRPVADIRSSLSRSDGEVAARRADGGAMARLRGPSTTRFAGGPPPHGCATGRINAFFVTLERDKWLGRLDPGSILAAPEKWIPDQVRNDEGLKSNEHDISSIVTLNLFQGPWSDGSFGAAPDARPGHGC